MRPVRTPPASCPVINGQREDEEVEDEEKEEGKAESRPVCDLPAALRGSPSSLSLSPLVFVFLS